MMERVWYLFLGAVGLYLLGSGLVEKVQHPDHLASDSLSFGIFLVLSATHSLSRGDKAAGAWLAAAFGAHFLVSAVTINVLIEAREDAVTRWFLLGFAGILLGSAAVGLAQRRRRAEGNQS